MAGLRSRIAPPPLSPPVINLVTSARNPEPVDPDTGKDIHWEQGFDFQPIPNQVPQLASVACGQGVEQDDVDPEPTVSTVPWTAMVEDKCSSIGFAAHDFVRRALIGLAAATPKAVEMEFWDGTVAQADSLDNLFLAMAAVDDRGDGFGPIVVNPTPGTAVSLGEAFQLLEEAIGKCGAGARGMIHAAPLTTPNLLGVRREGNLLLTARDTIVCSGSGYSGAGPLGDDDADPTDTTQWLYATGIPIVFLGDPYIESPGSEAQILTVPSESQLPGTVRYGGPGDDGPLKYLYRPESGVPYDSDLSADAIAELMGRALDDRFQAYFLDRDDNTIRARARRPVAATWDGVCHFAVLADITA